MWVHNRIFSSGFYIISKPLVFNILLMFSSWDKWSDFSNSSSKTFLAAVSTYFKGREESKESLLEKWIEHFSGRRELILIQPKYTFGGQNYQKCLPITSNFAKSLPRLNELHCLENLDNFIFWHTVFNKKVVSAALSHLRFSAFKRRRSSFEPQLHGT